MPAERLFSICGSLVLPGWLLIAFAPRWRWSQRIAGLAIPVLLALVYVVLIAANFRRNSGGFGSLAEVRMLFGNEFLLLAGWIHYLAFDLFIGAWESRDAVRNHIPGGVVWPCLLLTFVFGPLGLLSYLLMRGTIRRKVDLD